MARTRTRTPRSADSENSSQAKKGGNGANLGFEEKLWQAADKLRGNMDAADYKHVVLGLIFLPTSRPVFKALIGAPEHC
jgi:type I restriction enzyme M protein